MNVWILSSESALDSQPLLIVCALDDYLLECEPSFLDGKSLASEPLDSLSRVRPLREVIEERLLELQELLGLFIADFSAEIPTADDALPFL